MSDCTLQPVVFSGPSGVGKSTLLKRLFKEYPDAFGFSVSHTTRQPRSGEQDGVDYHFVTKEAMMAEIGRNSFIEYAEFADKMYGTSIKAVDNVTKSNRICILDIDEQGVKNIKASTLQSKYVFVSPPSVEELEKRLRGRGTETEETIKKRMDTAQSAMDFAKTTGVYDIVVVNDELEKAYHQLKSTLVSWFPTVLVSKDSVNGMGDAGAAVASGQGAATIEVGNTTDNVVAVQQPESGFWCSIL